MQKLCHVALITTGGTIEKTYDELSGVLENRVSVLDMMLAALELRGVRIQRFALMNKDSLEMTPEDHARIVAEVEKRASGHDGVIVVHGTDRLAVTGNALVDKLGTPPVPVVLTGAMRPWLMRSTDAQQNLTEALLAVQILDPGIYVVMHNQVLRFPGVSKDHASGTFISDPFR